MRQKLKILSNQCQNKWKLFFTNLQCRCTSIPGDRRRQNPLFNPTTDQSSSPVENYPDNCRRVRARPARCQKIPNSSNRVREWQYHLSPGY